MQHDLRFTKEFAVGHESDRGDLSIAADCRYHHRFFWIAQRFVFGTDFVRQANY